MSRWSRLLVPLAVVVPILGSPKVSQAVPYTFDVVVDSAAMTVDTLGVANPGMRVKFLAEFPEIDALFVVDTLHLNISFAPGLSIRLADLGAPFNGDNERIVGRTLVNSFRGSDRHDVYGFGGVIGTLLVNPHSTDDFDSDVNLTDDAFSFTALTLDLSWSDPVFDPALSLLRGFRGFDFEFWADHVEVIDATAVPEPSTLLLVGLGSLMFRRRVRS